MIVAQFFQLRTYFSLFFRVVAYQVIACMNFPCRKKRWTVCYRYIHRVEQQKQNLKWNVESPIGANIFSNVTKKGEPLRFFSFPLLLSLSVNSYRVSHCNSNFSDLLFSQRNSKRPYHYILGEKLWVIITENGSFTSTQDHCGQANFGLVREG